MFKNIGVTLCLIIFAIVTYEGAALLTGPGWPPTISRLMQGLRDGGHQSVVFIISCIFVCIFAIFGAWLYYHLNYQVRSGN